MGCIALYSQEQHVFDVISFRLGGGSGVLVSAVLLGLCLVGMESTRAEHVFS